MSPPLTCLGRMYMSKLSLQGRAKKHEELVEAAELEHIFALYALGKCYL